MLSTILHLPVFNFLCTSYFACIILFACLILFSPNVIFSLLSLVIVFLLTSIMFIYIGAEYAGLIYIIVYVGAIAILFLFVLMLLNLRGSILDSEDLLLKHLTFYIVIVIVESLTFIYELFPFYYFVRDPFFVYNWPAYLSSFAFNYEIFGISSLLFGVYSIYIIICGFILLFIMLGVILLVNITDFDASLKLTVSQRNKILQDYLNSLRIARTNYDFPGK